MQKYKEPNCVKDLEAQVNKLQLQVEYHTNQLPPPTRGLMNASNLQNQEVTNMEQNLEW